MGWEPWILVEEKQKHLQVTVLDSRHWIVGLQHPATTMTCYPWVDHSWSLLQGHEGYPLPLGSYLVLMVQCFYPYPLTITSSHTRLWVLVSGSSVVGFWVCAWVLGLFGMCGSWQTSGGDLGVSGILQPRVLVVQGPRLCAGETAALPLLPALLLWHLPAAWKARQGWVYSDIMGQFTWGNLNWFKFESSAGTVLVSVKPV